MRTKTKAVLGIGLGLAGLTPVLPVGGAGAASPAATQGRFGPLFEEPHSVAGDVDCGARGFNATGNPPAPTNCKPAAMALAVLPDGRELYWDGLEGMNQISLNTVAQFSGVAANDQSRVMRIGPGGAASWKVPTPSTGPGGNHQNQSGDYLPGAPVYANANAASDLFCAALAQMPDGRVLVAGGTDYYLEPGAGTPAGGVGLSELEGLRVTRVFDPASDTWSWAGNMNYGRWYPELVTLPDGRIFVASGVTKLIKPVYPNSPGYHNTVADSGTNVKQTETFNPASGTWTYNGASADKSLPLFPRLHLLPDGKIYYDAGGQTFNPDGQSYDEALWNLTGVYDPTARTWTNLGVPTIGGLPLGFRGSGFSIMLPLVPDRNGNYRSAQFLSAGGVIGVSPGTYLGTDTSTLDTVTMNSGTDTFTSSATGNLNHARWYSTGVALPDGEVFAVNGADRDEVVNPGSGTPVTQAELYDPVTRTWRVAATETDGRTYHNTAVLLPDGSVLVGGHAPIATGYAFQDDAGTAVGLSKAESDPSFQIYYPPYMEWGLPRPVIDAVSSPSLSAGGTVGLRVSTPGAGPIAGVVLVRNPSITHLVDGDQRTVDLPFRVSGGRVTARVPGAAVVPPGPYMLFVLQRTPRGLLPSASAQVVVG